MGENIGLWAHWLSDSQWGWEEMQVESRSIWCGAWSSLCWCVSEELHTPKDRREEVEQGKSQRPNPMSPSVSAKQMPYCPQSLLWPHFIFHLPLEWNRLPHALSGFNGRQRWGQVVQCMDPSVSENPLHQHPGGTQAGCGPRNPCLWRWSWVCLCSVVSNSLQLMAPLFMGFPQQEYWSRLLLPPPGDLSQHLLSTHPTTWVQILILPHTTCNLLGKWFKLLVPRFPPL